MADINRGFFDSTSRVVEEAIGKTAFKDGLRLFLKNIDPENSPQLVRVLMGKDIEVPLAFVSTLPAIVNAIIRALDELIIQVNDKFSPPLLSSFVESLLDEIDKETLARFVTNARVLVQDFSPLFQAVWKTVEDRMKIEGGK
jgi:hypothetical protein